MHTYTPCHSGELSWFDRIRFRCQPFVLYSLFFLLLNCVYILIVSVISYFPPVLVMRYCLFVEGYFSAIALHTLTITWYSLERNLWHFSFALQYSSLFGWHMHCTHRNTTIRRSIRAKIAEILPLPKCNPSNEKEKTQNKFIHIMDLLGIISFRHCSCSVWYFSFRFLVFFSVNWVSFLRVEW